MRSRPQNLHTTHQKGTTVSVTKETAIITYTMTETIEIEGQSTVSRAHAERTLGKALDTATSEELLEYVVAHVAEDDRHLSVLAVTDREGTAALNG